jgi:hypothetical protein
VRRAPSRRETPTSTNRSAIMNFEWYLAQAERCLRLAKSISDPNTIAVLEEIGRTHLHAAEQILARKRSRVRKRLTAGARPDEPSAKAFEHAVAAGDTDPLQWLSHAGRFAALAEALRTSPMRDRLTARAEECRSIADLCARQPQMGKRGSR